MAHFIGYVQGTRGEASRLGGRESGIRASARGWDLGVRVYGDTHEVDGKDVDTFSVLVDGGSNGRMSSREVFEVRKDDEGEYVITGDVFDRLALIAEVQDKIMIETTIYGGPVWFQLPILYAAIAAGEEARLDTGQRPQDLISLLTRFFGPPEFPEGGRPHPIWNHIRLHGEADTDA